MSKIFPPAYSREHSRKPHPQAEPPLLNRYPIPVVNEIGQVFECCSRTLMLIQRQREVGVGVEPESLKGVFKFADAIQPPRNCIVYEGLDLYWLLNYSCASPSVWFLNRIQMCFEKLKSSSHEETTISVHHYRRRRAENGNQVNTAKGQIPSGQNKG